MKIPFSKPTSSEVQSIHQIPARDQAPALESHPAVRTSRSSTARGKIGGAVLASLLALSVLATPIASGDTTGLVWKIIEPLATWTS